MTLKQASPSENNKEIDFQSQNKEQRITSSIIPDSDDPENKEKGQQPTIENEKNGIQSKIEVKKLKNHIKRLQSENFDLMESGNKGFKTRIKELNSENTDLKTKINSIETRVQGL